MPDLAQPLLSWLHGNYPWIVLAIALHVTVLGAVAFMILGERKVAAWAQDRIGPNRAGLGLGIIPILKNYRFLGIGQSFADGVKMLMKEDYRSPNADRALFTIAPMIMMSVVVVSIAVLPWGGTYGRPTTLDIGDDVRAGTPVLAAIEANLTGPDRVESPVVLSGTSAGGPIDARLDGNGAIIDRATGAAVDASAVTALTASFVAGWRFQIANLNIGVVFILAVLSLAVYGTVIGGYASNNKFSFLGGLRATANMISYEIPLGLAVLTVCLMYGSFDLGEIVNSQAKYWGGVIPAWNVFAHPLTFLLFLICIHAEANRAPFDTAECEQELVGGYHTEYSSMRFGMFFLAEYAGMITTSAIAVALFFGGWHVPYLDYLWPALRGADAGGVHATDSILAGLVRIACFFAKTMGVVFIFMWVRWSVPRFRFDQIMGLAWKGLIPVSLATLVATAAGVFIVSKAGGTTTNGLGFREAVLFLGLNLAVAAGTLVVGTALKVGTSYKNTKVSVPDSRYAPLAISSA